VPLPSSLREINISVDWSGGHMNPNTTEQELTVETLIEDVSIDGMCGVY